MNFLASIKLILKKNIAFGDNISPIEIMDAINTQAGGELINYKNFKLYKRKDFGDQWFSNMIMRFYDFQIMANKSDNFTAATITFFLDLFEYFESIADKYIFFYDLITSYEDYKINLLNNTITTTIKNNNTIFLMPQVKEADETPNNKTKDESTQKVEYNTDYIEKIKKIYNNYINFMDDFINEFNRFFYYDL